MLYKQTLEDHFYSNIIKTGFRKTFRETRHSTGNQRQDQAHAKGSPKLLTPEPPQKLVYRAHTLETRYTVWPILVFRIHNYKCGEVIKTLKLQKSRSLQCRTPAYLQLPVIELPAWRVVVSQINSDSNVSAMQPPSILVAFCHQCLSVFFREGVCDSTRNDHHLESSQRHTTYT